MADKSGHILLATCNRRPFLSDSGCDRGNVDINQFNDFPFCDSILPDPEVPEVPPEVLDTPLMIPIPPACACVNIEHKIKFKYNKEKKFVASASFSASGDCCEGNYNTKLNLQIPCPIDKNDKNAGKIKVNIDYGKWKISDSASFIKANAESCTIEPLAPEINLNLPCPVTNKKNPKIKATVKYGNNGSSRSKSYASTDSSSCTVNLKDINIDLQLPCPVTNKKNPKIKATVKYGNNGSSGSKIYASTDSLSCTVNLKDINLDLKLRCPVTYRLASAIASALRDAAESDALNEYQKNRILAIAVDVMRRAAEIEKLVPSRYMDATNREILKARIRSELVRLYPDLSGILLSMDGIAKESVTNYVVRRLKLKIWLGKNTYEASASFLAVDSSDCTIEPLVPHLNLQLPCPVTNKKNPKIKATVKYGNGGSSGSKIYASTDSLSCTVNLKDINLDLQLRCPVTYRLAPAIASALRDAAESDALNEYQKNRILAIAVDVMRRAAEIEKLVPSSYMDATSREILKARIKSELGRLYPDLSGMLLSIDGIAEESVTNYVLRRLKLKIWLGKNHYEASASFLAVDRSDCTIEPLAPHLNLQIPCPVKGEKNPKIKASIKYGSGGNSASASYASADSQGCTVGLKNASLDLQIPCPVGPSYISFTGEAKYGNDSKGKVSFTDESVPSAGECRRRIKLAITFPKGGGGGITVGTGKIVQIRLEWVGQDHQDFESHPYTLKVVRGEIEINNNVLSVVEKASLAQYLPTTPLSEEDRQ